jgi:hypothetical protein
MSLFRDLWEQNSETSKAIQVEQDNVLKNADVVKAVSKIDTTIISWKVFTTEFGLMDSLIIDDNHEYYFKEWKIKLFEGTLSEVNNLIDNIMANTSFEVIYNDSIQNFLDFYNMGNELRQVDFFTIEADNSIWITIAVSIIKPFQGHAIINPQVKLDIALKPFTSTRE